MICSMGSRTTFRSSSRYRTPRSPYDRTDKLACYASNDTPEYWIVNLQNRTLERYRGPADDEYRERRTLDPADTVAPEFDDALSARVEALLPTQPEPDSDSDGE